MYSIIFVRCMLLPRFLHGRKRGTERYKSFICLAFLKGGLLTIFSLVNVKELQQINSKIIG